MILYLENWPFKKVRFLPFLRTQFYLQNNIFPSSNFYPLKKKFYNRTDAIKGGRRPWWSCSHSSHVWTCSFLSSSRNNRLFGSDFVVPRIIDLSLLPRYFLRYVLYWKVFEYFLKFLKIWYLINFCRSCIAAQFFWSNHICAVLDSVS